MCSWCHISPHTEGALFSLEFNALTPLSYGPPYLERAIETPPRQHWHRAGIWIHFWILHFPSDLFKPLIEGGRKAKEPVS